MLQYLDGGAISTRMASKRRAFLATVPSTLVMGCIGQESIPGGSIVVENNDSSTHTVSVEIIDGSSEGKEESRNISPGERKVMRAFVGTGGEFRLRVTVDPYGSQEVSISQVYDSNAGDYVEVDIESDGFTTSVEPN